MRATRYVPEDRRILAARGHGRILVWGAWEIEVGRGIRDAAVRGGYDRQILAVHAGARPRSGLGRLCGSVGMLLWGRLKRPMSLMVGGSAIISCNLASVHTHFILICAYLPYTMFSILPNYKQRR